MNELILENRYKIVWQLKEMPHYKITECRNIINCRTNRKLKRTVIGTTVGYWINKRFIPINRLNDFCEKITDERIPF